MDNSTISLVVAGFALLVSIITGAYQIYRSHKETALQIEVARSSLLSEILHLIYNNQEHICIIQRLFNEAKTNRRPELFPTLEELSKKTNNNQKIFMETYEGLFKQKSPKPEVIERIRHMIESMNHQSKLILSSISQYHINPSDEQQT